MFKQVTLAAATALQMGIACAETLPVKAPIIPTEQANSRLLEIPTSGWICNFLQARWQVAHKRQNTEELKTIEADISKLCPDDLTPSS